MVLDREAEIVHENSLDQHKTFLPNKNLSRDSNGQE